MPRRSKRLLALADDDRLVQQIRAGNEAAFEVVFERYGTGILGFCRHMLGSQEEAEDALQQTFASAYRDVLRDDERELRLKPWLYTIARNRCLSVLRARREQVQLDREVPTAGLAEQVEQRAELRDLLGDIGELPAEQRAALLLAEVADLSHAEIGQVLDCEAARVKALVFRARSSLIERREARATPCEDIREQLAVLSGGSLRRSELRHHLHACPGCRAYRDQVKRQRQLLAAALPVVPPAWLKAHVLGAAGGGGASAASAGGASVLATGAGAGAGAAGGSALVAKVTVLTVLTAAGGVATQAALERHQPNRGASPSSAGSSGTAGHGSATHSAAPGSPTAGRRNADSPSAGRAGSGSHSSGSGSTSTPAHGAPADKPGRGPAEVPGSRGQGADRRAPQANDVPHGNGPPAVPPSQAPVRRRPDHPAHPTPPPQAQEHPAHPAHPVTPPPHAGGIGGVSE